MLQTITLRKLEIIMTN